MPDVRRRHLAAAVLLSLAGQLVAPATGRGDDLETGEVVALVAAPAVLWWSGNHIHAASRGAPPRWTEPPAIDRWAAIHLAPSPRSTRGNFMDSDLASTLNAVAGGAAVGGLDAAFPRADGDRAAARGQLFYWSGYACLQGVQKAVKGAVGRQRPLWRLAPEVAAGREGVDADYARESFWSGHASGAFYASTYLNLRLRAMMRRELSAAEYDDWSWVPPATLFTWATWVAYSRIHAHQHYLTDVLVGAGAGAAVALLFASLDEDAADGPASGAPIPLATFGGRF